MQAAVVVILQGQDKETRALDDSKQELFVPYKLMNEVFDLCLTCLMLNILLNTFSLWS